MGEDHIKRTTIYFPLYLHDKAKESGINISREVTTYLETVLFGDEVCDVNYELSQIEEQIKGTKKKLSMLQSRKEQLKKTLGEHDAKLSVEKSAFNKFMNHCRGHIKNLDLGYSIDRNKVRHYWGKEYFNGNGINEKNVEIILDLVKKDRFTLDNFKNVRKGNFAEITR